MPRVPVKIVDELGPGDEHRRTTREWQSGKRREMSARVQPEAVVKIRPCVCQVGAPLEHDVVDATAHQVVRGGETRGAGSDDDHIARVISIDAHRAFCICPHPTMIAENPDAGFFVAGIPIPCLCFMPVR